MNKFKVGDRVIAYNNYFVGGVHNYSRKGEVLAILGNCLQIYNKKLNNHFIVHYKQCRKLVNKCKPKPKPKFKVGDRIVAITLVGNKYKGTIVEIIDTNDCNYYDVKFDNKNLISIIPFPTNQLKKLRKKKTVFKIGDRVNAYYPNKDLRGKGTIEGMDHEFNFATGCCDSNLIISFDDGHEGIWEDKYLKKLKKKCKIIGCN
jgi:hypothetical protein